MSDEAELPLDRLLLAADTGTSAGDDEAARLVADLYDQLRPSMHGYVYYLTGDSHEADDLLQAAFLRLFQQVRRQRSVQNVRAWLYRVVHNLVMDSARRREVDATARTRWHEAQNSLPGASSAEETLIRRQEVQRAMARLNEREQRCLMLRADGLSYQEIGDVLGMSRKAVSVHLARGLKKFARRHERS